MKDKIEIFVNQNDEGKKLKQSVFGILLGSFIGIICAIVCDEIIYILPITILLFIAIIISYIVYKIRTRNLVPAISILPDRVEFAKKNFLLRYGITKILYDQIQMLGTELYKLERYGENKYIRIRLKTGNDFYFNVDLFDMDSAKLCELIHEVNPSIKLNDLGVIRKPKFFGL